MAVTRTFPLPETPAGAVPPPNARTWSERTFGSGILASRTSDRRFRAGGPTPADRGRAVAQGHVVPRDRVGGPFHVRLRTVSLDIVGEDAEGTLLLAVVPLPAPAAVEAEGTIQRSVTLDGGQRLTLDITLGAGTRGEAG